MTIPNPSNLPEIAHVFAMGANGQITSGANAAGGLFTPSLTAGAFNGSGTLPTLAAGAGAGVGAAVSAQKGHDCAGSFIVTTAGTPAAGALATVTFGTALAAAPVVVLLNCWDNTGAAQVAVGVTSASTTGFAVSTGATVTTAHALLINYLVVAS